MSDAQRSVTDAAIDTASDAELGIRYDVAYINEIHVSSEIAVMRGVVLVINKSTVPMSLDTLTVVSFASDTPGVEWVFARDVGASVKLAPGRAAGALTPSSTVQLVDSGLVNEPFGDRSLDFTISFAFEPPPGLKFRARAVIEFEGRRATLPFEFYTTSTGLFEPIAAARISAAP